MAVHGARGWGIVLVGVLAVSVSSSCGDDDRYRAMCDAARAMDATPEGHPADEVERRLDRLREVAPDSMRRDLGALISRIDGSTSSPMDAAATERIRVVLSERCHVDLAILGVAEPKSPTP